MGKDWYLELKEDPLRTRNFVDMNDRVQCYWEHYMKADDICRPAPTAESMGTTALEAEDVRNLRDASFSTLLCLYQTDGLECSVSKYGYRRLQRQLPYRGHYHTHDYIELLYIVRGSFEQIMLGEAVRFQTGDVIITDQNLSHADLVSGEEDSAVLFISLQADYLHQLLSLNPVENVLSSYFFRALRRQQNLQSYLHLETRHPSSQIPVILERLMEEDYHNLPGSSMIASGNLIRLFSYLCTDYTLQLHESGPESKERLLLYEVERYIHLHYDTVTAVELEQIFHYHRNYFNLLLQKYIHMSFIEYLKQVRMHAAAQFLTTTDLPIKEIAARIGYQNSSFFYDLFKKQYGRTPREYREHPPI